MRLLQDVPVNDYGLHLRGWALQNTTSISYDPSTNTGAWIAVIPEASSVLLPGAEVGCRDFTRLRRANQDTQSVDSAAPPP